MKRFETIPHTADVRLWVEASSMDELIRGALMGMGEILRCGVCDPGKILDVTEKVEVGSVDAPSLLIDFLNEALALEEEEYAVFCDVQFESLSDRALRATISGAHVDGFAREIKAVTYHGSAITTNDKGNLETTVLFDI